MSHTVASQPNRADSAPGRASGRAWTERTVWSTAREMALVGTMFVLYLQVRHVTSGDVDGAMRNADRVVGFEQRLGLFTEGAFQRAVLHSRLAIEVLDHYYVFVHFTASFGFMAWMFLRHPAAWARVRAWFLTVTIAGLAIHVAFPLAPPRMLAHHGFIDTLHEYGPSIYSRDVTSSAANQLAAMPSLHFAWAAIVAVGVVGACRSRWRWVAVLHPAITLTAIVATANHYWLDAAVGGALVAVSVATTSAVAAHRAALPMPVVIRRPVAPAFAMPRYRIERVSTITATPVLTPRSDGHLRRRPHPHPPRRATMAHAHHRSRGGDVRSVDRRPPGRPDRSAAGLRSA